MSVSGAQANIVSYITKTTEAAPRVDGTRVFEYDYTIASWSDESDAQPNPCYMTLCYIFLDHRHTQDGMSGNRDAHQFKAIEISYMKTIGDVRKAWIAQHPLPNIGTTEHAGEVLTNECVGLFYGNTGLHPNGDTLPIFPGSICGLAPAPTGHCQLSGDVTIDYGSVTAAELNGKQASATASVTCDTAMPLDIWISNPQDGSDEVPLRSDKSIVAKLTLNGASAKDGQQIQTTAGTPVPLTITSEATVTGSPEAGEFSGSAVLFVSVP